MTRLSVNLNKIAGLRNARGGGTPDLVTAAVACLDAGAHGLTLHPRPDGRHALTADVVALAALARERGVEFNLEGNPFAAPRPGYPGFLALCQQVRPTQATLVPDDDGQLTSDHGFDLAASGGSLSPTVAALRGMGCRVSLFADVDGEVALAAEIGADRIELYTGPYAGASAATARHSDDVAKVAMDACASAARRAQAAGLGVNAGHDLDQRNLWPLLRAVPGILEVSIGHALVSEALYDGLATTVARYVAIVGRARIG